MLLSLMDALSPEGCSYLQRNKHTNCLHFGILGFGKCEVLHFHQSRKGMLLICDILSLQLHVKHDKFQRNNPEWSLCPFLTASPDLSHLHSIMTSKVTMESVKGKDICKRKLPGDQFGVMRFCACCFGLVYYLLKI